LTSLETTREHPTVSSTPFDVNNSPPVPERSALTAFYWDAVDAHRLDLLRCRGCGHFVHYPRPICPRCLDTDLAPEPISGRGSLYSYCEVLQASHPYFFDKLPYLIGVIDIEEEPGVRLPTGLVDCTRDDLRCGIPMEVVFRDLTPILTLPYFRPTGGSR
jgi:uncharacterized OB-fold protein